jgi:hypothetical protein
LVYGLDRWVVIMGSGILFLSLKSLEETKKRQGRLPTYKQEHIFLVSTTAANQPNQESTYSFFGRNGGMIAHHIIDRNTNRKRNTSINEFAIDLFGI